MAQANVLDRVFAHRILAGWRGAYMAKRLAVGGEGTRDGVGGSDGIFLVEHVANSAANVA